MKLNTASAVVSFAQKIEEDTALVYQSACSRFNRKEKLIPLTAEGVKNKKQIESTYYNSVTDIFEGCFAFDLDTDSYRLSFFPVLSDSYFDFLKQAVEIENNTLKFYQDASLQAKSLMPDIARLFTLMARKRAERKKTLETEISEVTVAHNDKPE